MYRRRIQQEFPPNTFIPFPARVVAILQLCLAFSLLLWQASQPFMGDLFRIKSQMLMYQDVMGIGDENHKIRLERNAEHFAALPDNLKRILVEKYDFLQEQLSHSFRQKLHRLFHLFAYGISSYELSWILFSVIIAILVLKRTEGAQHATWILPGLALLFLFDNHRNGVVADTPENSLFPSEQEIVQNYLQEPFSKDIFQQREQLLKGWHVYLVKEWAKEDPSEMLPLFQQQAEKGEFLFNVSRLLKQNPFQNHSSPKKSHLFLLFLYLGWNLFFACFINGNKIFVKLPIETYKYTATR